MSKSIICIGATLIDELYFCDEAVLPATSNPASMKRSAGGVVANIARHLALLDIPVKFLTVLGNDPDADWLKKEFSDHGIDMSADMHADCATGKYAALLNADGSLFAAACVNPGEKFLTPAFLEERKQIIATASMVIADTNLSIDSINWLNDFCKKSGIKFIIEPVSIAKARKLAEASVDGLYMVTPNEDELPSLAMNDDRDLIAHLLKRKIQKVWLRKGERGSSIFSGAGELSLNAASIEVKDITGAGDAALAGWAAAHILGMNELDCLKAGHALAAEVIQTEGAIVKQINRQGLFNAIKKYYGNE